MLIVIVVGVALGKAKSYFHILRSAGAAMHRKEFHITIFIFLTNLHSPVVNPVFVHQSSPEQQEASAEPAKWVSVFEVLSYLKTIISFLIRQLTTCKHPENSHGKGAECFEFGLIQLSGGIVQILVEGWLH